MDYVQIQHSIMPHLLEVLKDSDFNWSAVKDAAQKAGLDYGLVRLAFKDSLNTVLEELSSYLGTLVEQVLREEDVTHLRTHEKIRRMIEVRFMVLEPYKKVLKTLSKFEIFIRYFSINCQMLYNTMNKIWYKAGDRATDYNFYTKRILLTVVYVPTFLDWLKPQSTLESVMVLLDQRLARVMKIPKIKGQILQGIKSVLPFTRKH